jgi:hypothetical protein
VPRLGGPHHADHGHERLHTVDQPRHVSVVHGFDDLGDRGRITGSDSGVAPTLPPRAIERLI